ncbi:MAG TPA: NAD-dependent protein deacylase [Bacillota bacterium]|nr:NAD-dependent protein deacylase [Bacillota bacterium]HOK69597.1 NAD-dependent protein deacylase [Bacillota bacterium]HPP85969.1 NAD-dependent protein deacylase [Bacillota bacterium]
MNAKLKKLIDQSNRIVFFGGAGVSTESGIPDFRSTDGLYNQKYDYPPELMLSHEFFFEHTEEFYKFYRDKMLYPNVKPNKAHYALAKLESEGKLKAVITQNIDNLHQAAGSKNVLELHGSVYRNYCIKCCKFYPLETVLNSTGVPRCDCGGIIKPDVVLYGEQLDEEVLDKSVSAIHTADMLIVGGTSLNVYPAAGLLHFFRGRFLVVINKTPTPADQMAALVFNEPIGEVLGD